MLPTSGYFKDIDCPYYDNACGRPYCHFRHRKRSQDPVDDHQEDDIITTEIPTYKPTPKSELAKTKSHIPISYVPDTVIRPERTSRMTSMYNYTEKITYKPTPLSELPKTNAINTVDLVDKDLFCVSDSVVETTKIEVPGLKHNLECDIDFEELSTEFDMIDDIINDSPSAPETERLFEEQTKQSKESKKHENCDNSNNSNSKTSKSKSSSRSSSSKTKDEKSKHSKSTSNSSGSHKSSHKSKSDNHRSRSRERSKDKSETKHKDDKKKDHKSKDKKSDGKNDKEKHKSKESKSSSRSGSSSKHKEYHKSKRKDKEDTKEKHKKKEKKEEKIEVPKYEIDDVFDDEDYGMFNEDLEEECYRIFNEYKPEVVTKTPEVVVEEEKPEAVEEYVPTSKKRVAHMGAEQYVPKITPVKSKPSHNASLQMANRYKTVREAKETEENDIVAVLNKHGTKRQNLILETYKTMKKAKMKRLSIDNNEDSYQSTSLVDDIINGKNANEVTYKPTPIAKLNAEEVKTKPKRIAPAMNVSSIQLAKAKLAEMTKRKELKTPVQTISKGNKRVAHTPDTSLGELPDVLEPENKKIPFNVRSRYLTMIADECVKLYVNKQDAYSRAVTEEHKVLERCKTIPTYRNSAMLAVNRIRKELQDRESKGLGPLLSNETSVSSVDSQFKGRKFYENVLSYVLKEDDLEEHGYPREGPISGKAVVKAQKQMPRVNLDENQRLCCRCFKVYLVDDVGFPLYEDECIYHSLKKRTLKGERIYLCCKSTEDTGCVTSNTHVSESEETDLTGFQTTMDPERDDDPRSCSVYALDCEMCYTTKGLELTRVTIIDPDCKTVYESLVKPLNPIIDYNTQFSGITKEQMDRTSTSILQVQANILHLCNSKTILIGHSLESDMKALKIVHSCVLDTAILFPHRLGLPHKRALRTLASEYLNKIIQSDVAGHDSAEDAITCMQLVIWKLKEDLKVRGVK